MPDNSPHPATGQNGRIAMISGGSLERDAKLARLATLAGYTPLPMDHTQPADFLLIDRFLRNGQARRYRIADNALSPNISQHCIDLV
jgi:hypothetical protein